MDDWMLLYSPEEETGGEEEPTQEEEEQEEQEDEDVIEVKTSKGTVRKIDLKNREGLKRMIGQGLDSTEKYEEAKKVKDKLPQIIRNAMGGDTESARELMKIGGYTEQEIQSVIDRLQGGQEEEEEEKKPPKKKKEKKEEEEPQEVVDEQARSLSFKMAKQTVKASLKSALASNSEVSTLSKDEKHGKARYERIERASQIYLADHIQQHGLDLDGLDEAAEKAVERAMDEVRPFLSGGDPPNAGRSGAGANADNTETKPRKRPSSVDRSKFVGYLESRLVDALGNQ